MHGTLRSKNSEELRTHKLANPNASSLKCENCPATQREDVTCDLISAAPNCVDNSPKLDCQPAGLCTLPSSTSASRILD